MRISDEFFSEGELEKCIENKTHIKFTYQTYDIIRVFPSKIIIKKFESDILSAYTIDDNGKKKWRRFKINLMKKV